MVFLTLGTLLTVTGMSRELADACASLGGAYLVLAPWIGAVGGFLAGSNTGANAMFAAGQAGAAQALGYSAGHLVAVQNVSAALASGAAVARVALAAELATTAHGPAPGPAEPSSPAAERTAGGGTAVRTAAPARTAAGAPADTGWVLRTVLVVHALVFVTLGIIASVWR
ncbi:L-lactate permease [Streptomyces sp. AV19]|nr:L-lactate permease [Streptomyces sp. AV19]